MTIDDLLTARSGVYVPITDPLVGIDRPARGAHPPGTPPGTVNVIPTVPPSYRWRPKGGRAAGSAEFPGIVGGSSQVFLAVP
ncbi:MAG: hypothetical protein QOE54_7365, partial [Streptosporangiaceae bacterium]|nr:hypothetical protein [Streptosporangiaceae bacterium]